jgi:hypothetical protein
VFAGQRQPPRPSLTDGGGQLTTHLVPSQTPEAHSDPAVQSPPLDVLQTPLAGVFPGGQVQALGAHVEPTGDWHVHPAASTVAVVEPDAQGVQVAPPTYVLRGQTQTASSATWGGVQMRTAVQTPLVHVCEMQPSSAAQGEPSMPRHLSVGVVVSSCPTGQSHALMACC